MSDTPKAIDPAALTNAVNVLRDACEKLLAHLDYQTWTDQHLEIAKDRAFTPEILKEIELVRMAREALKMTDFSQTKPTETTHTT